MIIPSHHFDRIPGPVLHLNDAGAACDDFRSYVDQENRFEYREFLFNEEQFLVAWTNWTTELQSEQFLKSAGITLRMRHVLGALCAHLSRQPLVTVSDDIQYFVGQLEPHERARLNAIAPHPTQYFAVFFCFSNYNLSMRMRPMQSQRPGGHHLSELCETYASDPDRAREVIADLQSFVRLELVR